VTLTRRNITNRHWTAWWYCLYRMVL